MIETVIIVGLVALLIYVNERRERAEAKLRDITYASNRHKPSH